MGDFSDGLIPNEIINNVLDNGINNIRAWREHMRMTQSELAQKMGITQAALAQIESDKRPRKATLEKAAAAMGLTLEQLDW